MVPFSKYLFSFVMLAFLVCFCDGLYPDKKTHVRIINELGDGIDLNHHCKSKDDDLGIHVLAPHQFFEFSFVPNFWGTTLFFCKFWWGNEDHWFNIYVMSRDSHRCTKQCWWRVNYFGPCLLDGRVKKYTLCEKWNDKKLQGSGKGNSTAKIYNDYEYLEAGEKKGK